jgi:murein DD-endopeptidase MepM/ murein hydrolase activator NlpD
MRIPGDQADGPYLDWHPPFAGIDLHPVPAIQGETLAIHITLTTPVSVTGSLLGRPLTFFSDGDSQVALTGIEAMTEEIGPTLIITTTGSGGDEAHYAQRLAVAAGDYGAETITVSAETAAQMTAEAVTGEDQFLGDLFSARTPVRQWDGLFSLPAAGDITSSFGTRRTYNIPNGSVYHTGTDFGRMVGTPVYAPAGGTVVYTGTLTVRGNVVILDHGWGVMTGYWHLSAIYIGPGDVVVPGQHIGDIGNSGLSTGPHLHWEVRVNGVPVNGLQWTQEEFP